MVDRLLVHQRVLQKFHRIEYSESLEWYQHGKLRPHTDAGLVTAKAGEAIGTLLCNLSPFLHPFNIVVLQSSTLPSCRSRACAVLKYSYKDG